MVMKRYSVQMPDELVEALEAAALRSRRSVSAEIVVAVEDALSGLKRRTPPPGAPLDSVYADGTPVYPGYVGSPEVKSVPFEEAP